jgi:hypothetical protein
MVRRRATGDPALGGADVGPGEGHARSVASGCKVVKSEWDEFRRSQRS